MQDENTNKINEIPVTPNMGDLTVEDKQKFVGVFVWLIEEDKKQNPELYKTKKKHD